MRNGFFYPFGRLLYTIRWFIIALWCIVFLCCLPFASKLSEPFKTIGFQDNYSESAKADKLLYKTLGYSNNNFIVLFTSRHSFAYHPEYLTEIKKSLSGLKKLPLKNKIIYPTNQNHQISRDHHSAYAVVLVYSNKDIGEDLVKKFKALIKKTAHLEIKLGGVPIFFQNIQTLTQRDLYRNEYIATPVALITMLIVFGSVVAGLLPIILGGIAAFLTFIALYFLGQYVELSVFTLNIALLLSAILSLDYSLLIINRYRDELKHENNYQKIIGITQCTAGKSVFFSGVAVLISLSALMLFHVNILFSIGMGGLVAALVAMLVGLILLPAILSVLGLKINFLYISIFKRKNTVQSYWHWIIVRIVKRPWIYSIILLLTLLALGYPFLYVKIGTSDYQMLPRANESRDFFDTFSDKFGASNLSPIYLIAQSKHNSILDKTNISHLYDIVHNLKKDKHIKEINSIVSIKPNITKKQYEMMYAKGKHSRPKELNELLEVTTKNNLTVISIISKTTVYSEGTNSLVENLHHIKSDKNYDYLLTGNSVNTFDVKQSIIKTLPYACLWIAGFTYLILLCLLRSIFLPIKATLSTILSLCASYGVLVLVFQEGYLHQLLHFEKQPILDVTLLIIIFCALFGVSMDYEVFILTRIKEYYEITNDNIKSILSGIERSSRIITSAAMIVIVVCFAFITADTIMIKAFGLGIAVAVFIDAFIIRSLFVPAIMAILGKWNWYAPKWLKKNLPHITFDPNKLEL